MAARPIPTPSLRTGNVKPSNPWRSGKSAGVWLSVGKVGTVEQASRRNRNKPLVWKTDTKLTALCRAVAPLNNVSGRLYIQQSERSQGTSSETVCGTGWSRSIISTSRLRPLRAEDKALRTPENATRKESGQGSEIETRAQRSRLVGLNLSGACCCKFSVRPQTHSRGLESC